jgi:hypothetical protein
VQVTTLRYLDGPLRGMEHQVSEASRLHDYCIVREGRLFDPHEPMSIPYDPYEIARLTTDILHTYMITGEGLRFVPNKDCK